MKTIMTDEELEQWIEEEYQRRLDGEDPHHDMIDHMPALRQLTEDVMSIEGTCNVVEFGFRTGNSTIAFLAGGATVWSYDIQPPQRAMPPELIERGWWQFNQLDTMHIKRIEPFDILLIDTLHNYEQVRAELRHAAPHLLNAKRMYFVALHDTVTFGDKDEIGDGPGINKAINEFLRKHKERWKVYHQMTTGHGLTVLYHPGRGMSWPKAPRVNT